MTGPQAVEQTKQLVDVSLGAGALAAPLWISYLESGLTVFMLIGGALLLGLRLYLTIKEVSKKEN